MNASHIRIRAKVDLSEISDAQCIGDIYQQTHKVLKLGQEKEENEINPVKYHYLKYKVERYNVVLV